MAAATSATAATTTSANEVTGWWNKSCIVSGRLDGKLAVVTGANTGIGAVTAAELARRGCTVIMACRNEERAVAAKTDILSKYGPSNPDNCTVDVADPSVIPSLSPVKSDQLLVEKLDLNSLASIRDFVKRVTTNHKKLDYLVNNAGLMLRDYEETEDGFEKTMGVNHLGPFLLTHSLIPMLKSNPGPTRIINVSSLVHSRGQLQKPDLHMSKATYDGFSAYCDSKLANVLHAKTLSKQLQGTNVQVASLHPGMIDTEFYRDWTNMKLRFMYAFTKPLLITPWQGAQTTMYTLLTNNLVSGAYYANCTLKRPSSVAENEAECDWLWKKSCEKLNINPNA